MITLAAKFLMNVNRISLFTLVLLSIFLLGCSEDTKEIDNIKLARFYMAQDKDALALNFLGTELKAGRNLREAHRLMGTLFNNAEFFGDAVSHFQSAIELGCTQACDEGLIDAYLGLGEYALAEQEFSANISDKNSKSSQFRLTLFEFFKNKNFQQAITQLEKIDIQGANYWILRLMYEQGRYEEIIASFDKAADYSADQLLLFAKAYYALKQYEKSNDILSLFGSNKTGQLLTKRKIQSIELLVKVNTALGRKDQAKLIYQEFLESNEDADYVRFRNALTHLSNSEFDGAIDEIGELSGAYPDNSPIALALAMAQFGKKNYQEVIASLGNVKGGINEHSMVLLASAYNKIGRPEETIDLLQGVERNNMLTVLLARAYFLKEDYKKSREMLEDILIDPDLDPVNRKLARLWFDLSQFNKLISSFSSNVGHSPAIKYLVIASYLKLQKISLARQYISNEPNPVLSREMLAYLEGRIGNLDKSIQIYSELAQQNPTRKNYFLLSLSYIKNNDYPAALKAIQAGTSLEGENQLLLKLANRIMLEENGFETRQWLDSFKADHRDYKKIQKMLANYQIRQGQNEKAIQRLTQFIEDEDSQIYYLMALAKKDSDPQDSVRLMEKSLSTEFSMLAASRLHTHYQGNNDTKNLERINSQIEQFGGINSRTTKLLARGYLFLKAYGKANALADLLIEQG